MWTPIDAHILQQLITEKDYERYSGELDVRKGTKVQCPNCEHYIEQDLNFNAGNPMSTSYRICSYQFCRLYTKLWSFNHDIKRCKFENMQKMQARIESALRMC